MSSSGSLIQPTLSNVFCQSNEDALIIVELILQRRLFTVQRRAQDRERADAVQSGNVFVFEHTDTGIKRWTDGVHWSPSRILGSFLLYRELSRPFPPGQKKRAQRRSSNKARRLQGGEVDEHQQQFLSMGVPGDPSQRGPAGDADRSLVGSLIDSYDFKTNGLVKKTISIQDETGRQFHLISYYIPQDVLDNRLSRPVDTYASIRPRSTLFVSSSLRQPATQDISRRPSFAEDGGADGMFDSSPTDEDDDSVAPSRIASLNRGDADYGPGKLDPHHGHGFLPGNFANGADYSYIPSPYFPGQTHPHGYAPELQHAGEHIVKGEGYDSVSHGHSAPRYHPPYPPTYTTGVSNPSVSASIPLPAPTETLASQNWSNSPYPFQGVGGMSGTGSIRSTYSTIGSNQYDRPMGSSPVTSNYSSTSSTAWSQPMYGTHSPHGPHNGNQSQMPERMRNPFPPEGSYGWTSSQQSPANTRTAPVGEEEVIPYSGHWTPQ